MSTEQFAIISSTGPFANINAPGAYVSISFVAFALHFHSDAI